MHIKLDLPAEKETSQMTRSEAMTSISCLSLVLLSMVLLDSQIAEASLFHLNFRNCSDNGAAIYKREVDHHTTMITMIKVLKVFDKKGIT